MVENLEKEKIIITGSEGIVGREISDYLAEIFDILKLSLRFGDDLTNEAFVTDYFAKNKAKYLINCFGFNDHVNSSKKQETLFDVSLESITKYLSVNVVALFSVCREFARNNEAKGIVNISSVYSMVSPLPSLYKDTEKHIGYSISKAAVNQMTKHLATHLAPRVRTNCIVLGGIKEKELEKFEKNYSAHVPLGRMMYPHEVNGIIEYLCSDKSTYVNGSIITIDGGWTAW